MGVTTLDGTDVSQPLEQLNQPMTRQERLVLLACFKRVLTVSEVAAYIGRTEAQIYKLTMSRLIPFYKPEKRLIYFDRLEIDEWLKRNPIKTADQIGQDADTHILSKPLGRKGVAR
jgi:excisionase family DNA binding protein